MNQQKNYNSPDWKGGLICSIISIFSLLLLLFLASFVLVRIAHFERFYVPSVYICLFLTSFVIAGLSVRCRGSAVLNALFSSLVVFFLIVIIMLIFSSQPFSLLRLIPISLMVFTSLVVSYFLSQTKVKKNKHFKFSYKK